VTPAAPTATWADPASIVSGTPLSSAQLDATAGDQSVSVLFSAEIGRNRN
jgi:hypothetical protein